MNLYNTTHLDSERLEGLFHRFAGPYPLDGIDVLVRYTRSAAFSGSCCYQTRRLCIRIGRRNKYPYGIKTYVARPQSNRTHWWRPPYTVYVQDAYQLALFLFRHELYHWLVRLARRNTRQKEGRCDRFAVRALVDGHAAVVYDPQGRPVAREEWDFQDLDGFVARALRRRTAPRLKMLPPPAVKPAARQRPKLDVAAPKSIGIPAEARQLWLFG